MKREKAIDFEKSLGEQGSWIKKKGQFFTNPIIVDLIVDLCIEAESIVLDPCSGSGIFLSRAYEKKRKKKELKGSHSELLNDLVGIEIDKHLSDLAMINLKLKEDRGFYPKIINQDFFDLKVTKDFKFDAIITNPPYTRQEVLENRTKLRDLVNEEWNLNISSKSSFYSYFFFHSAKFLEEKGKIGFLTSNSWLNSDYGKHLQKFFLDHFKILAIIDSKVERWFGDADVNTAITILEKCSKRKERDGNLVKFVQLKKPLKKIQRQELIDLISSDKKTNQVYEDEDLKIYPITQNNLRKESSGKQLDLFSQGIKKKGNWLKYLRAPSFFFEILEIGKNILHPLGEIAEINYGISNRANKFFKLTNSEIKEWEIESEFIQPFFSSTTECHSIFLNPDKLEYKTLRIHKDKKGLKGTNILKYIQWREKEKEKEKKRNWYEIPEDVRQNIILWNRIHNQRHIVYFNPFHVLESDYFIEINPRSSKKNQEIKQKVFCALLNTSLLAFFKECIGRNTLGGGALKTYCIDIPSMPMINNSSLSKSQIKDILSAFNNLLTRPIGSIFEEIGAKKPEEVSLSKVRSDRLELDNLIFEIFGLSKRERIKVYKSLVDLVRSRIAKAKNFI